MSLVGEVELQARRSFLCAYACVILRYMAAAFGLGKDAALLAESSLLKLPGIAIVFADMCWNEARK